MKTYNQAPLPFQGQKRRFLKAFKQCLNNFKTDATLNHSAKYTDIMIYDYKKSRD